MKEPKEILVLEKHVIKFFDEADYRFDSADHSKTYRNNFISGNQNTLTSQVGIEVFEDDVLISSCLIGSEGGATAITEHTTLISYGGLVLCCSNTIFKLTLPDLHLEWKTISDTATCFGIYYLDEDYVVHGELEITRLDKNGEIVWQQSGRDIWVTAEVYENFSVYDDYILATDWEYNTYKITFDGKIIEDYKVEPPKDNLQLEKVHTKKWWKFW